jgi:hypothetical protein
MKQKHQSMSQDFPIDSREYEPPSDDSGDEPSPA